MGKDVSCGKGDKVWRLKSPKEGKLCYLLASAIGVSSCTIHISLDFELL